MVTFFVRQRVGLVRCQARQRASTRSLIRLPGDDAAESFPAYLQELAAWAVNGVIAVLSMSGLFDGPAIMLFDGLPATGSRVL